MCKFCEPWNKRAKEVETEGECTLYVPVLLAEAVTDEPKNLDSWRIRNLKECLEGGYTFIITPGIDDSYNKFKYCPYCGRKLTPEQDFKKMMAYLRR